MHEPQTVDPGTDAPIHEEHDEPLAQRRVQQRLLMRTLGRRGIPVTPEQIEAIHACRVGETLGLWIDRAAYATTASEVLGG